MRGIPRLARQCYMHALLLLFFSTNAYANNVAISNLSLVNQNSSDETIQISFDISWSNSWRDSTNYDAVWIFAKYLKDGASEWEHVVLKSSGKNPAGYSRGSGTLLDIVVSSNADDRSYGCFIERSANGSGSVSTTSVKLLWDWGEAGNNLSVTDVIDEIRLYAIEMVYIPEASYWLGSGGLESGSFTDGSWSSGATIPFLVHSEESIPINTGEGNLWGTSESGDNTIGPAGALPSAWPKGYSAFYTMKYEISQGQWIDFFNTLTSTQKSTRDITSASGKNSDNEVYRNTVSWSTGDGSAGTNFRVACNYLSWMDLAAYADWAGLRPMTELEFEKACRGPLEPVADEYAWGSTDITQATGISNSGASNETASNSGNGLCVHDEHASVQGPLRSGFAAAGSTTRVQSGASYYGIMELSGNLLERTVTVSSIEGRGFTGSHGDGTVSANGNANNADWPGYSGTEVSGASGSGFRGGDWILDEGYARISDRFYAGHTNTARQNAYGGRLVRTAQ
jgi:formylglycine-generating enzyme required for sulfatase activity